MMRQLIGARIELGVAEALLVAHHGDRVGRAGGLRGEQLRQGGGPHRVGGVVPAVQDRAALLGGQNVEAADRPLGLRHRRLQQPNEPRRHRLHAGAVEQVGGIFDARR